MDNISPILRSGALRGKTPENRMEEAKILRQAVRSKRSMRSKNGTSVTSRFFSKLIFGSGDCWFWAGHVDALGYGRFLALGENKAHRVAYKLFHGEIPEGMRVLHECDTRCCVNPSHLFLGSQADNIKDMFSKGRNRNADVRGERNPMAKASREIVDKIRSMVDSGAKQIEAAKAFGLSPMTVSRIVRKESWK